VKFLIHSNGPTIATGYGVQTRQLATRLAAAGHEVAVSHTYGHQGGIVPWKTPLGDTVMMYPSGWKEQSNDVIAAHAEHFFQGDPSAGWIIPLMDVWGLVNPKLAEFQVAAWTPVDHQPCPTDVLAFFHRTGATPIAMSKFGERELFEAGLDPVYVPLAVDTKAYKPTFNIDVAGQTVDARTLFQLPQDAFVVGMVAMNKDPMDRKNFHGAFRAFGQFWQSHQNAVLFVHTDHSGAAGGFDLKTLAIHCGIPHHALVWTDQYAYRLGFPAEMMAAAYTAMDVLLAPSRSEGFCVPLIEAQACGTPVIASDFSAQPELVGAGWLVSGQPEWDPAQRSSQLCPSVVDIVARLEEAYAADLPALGLQAQQFAARYDADVVFDEFWRPFLATLEPAPVVVKPKMERVDVIVPAVRKGNKDRLLRSYEATAPLDKTAMFFGERVEDGETPSKSYAENVNRALGNYTADWVLIVGDDVEFTPGWFEAAQAISDRYDVIGTNDSEPGRVRNPAVAAGRHADHFFVRRSYIEDEGGSLDGRGSLMPTCYRHWYVDKEVIGLAKARGVFGMAMDSVIVHHHPGYDGDEAARAADPTYMAAVDGSEADRKTFMKRAPLIEGHRVGRGK
jgi:glycosyltransferase involved in cell wall biosynthesis